MSCCSVTCCISSVLNVCLIRTFFVSIVVLGSVEHSYCLYDIFKQLQYCQVLRFGLIILFSISMSLLKLSLLTAQTLCCVSKLAFV